MGSHFRGHRRPSFTLTDRLRHRIRDLERTIDGAIICAEPLRQLETGSPKLIEARLHHLRGQIAEFTADLSILAGLSNRADTPAKRPRRAPVAA